MTGTIAQFILLLIAHAVAGIYSSTLKYSKKITFIIWGTWVVLQTALLFYTEFVLTNWALQFFVGFILSLIGQYVIFFATTKGKLAQRVFTMLTYSIFFCIVMTFFAMVKGTLGQPYSFKQLCFRLSSPISFAMFAPCVEPLQRILRQVGHRLLL